MLAFYYFHGLHTKYNLEVSPSGLTYLTEDTVYIEAV